jgi:acetoacetyl-CoA synthetase
MTYRQPVWRPDAKNLQSQMAAFIRYCESRAGCSFASYDNFHLFSVEHFRSFWRYFLDWSGLPYTGDPTVVCTDDRLEQASFFPDLRLNYAQALLSGAICPDDSPALRSCRPYGVVEHLSRAELAIGVTAGATALRELGIGSHSCAAMVAFNDAAAVMATLAVLALGGTIATSAPEMGAEATIARFRAVSPDLLLCHVRTPYGGGDAQLQAKLAEIIQALPSLRTIILLDPDAEIGGISPSCHVFEELIAPHRGASFEWPLLPFNHPLFILFSSGTTGDPKGIVHGAGGTLLEHLKEHRLHCDLTSDDRLFFYTSTAWMMWNWSLSALACGVELVLYNGVVAADTLWKIVAEEQVTVFGTGPAYLQMGQRMGIMPREEMDLSALRQVLSTGSILYEQQQAWFSQYVKDLPIQSISGGTDIIGCFVMGNPILPAYPGEPQCKGLGFDLRALPAGELPTGYVGELVCANPFPSRPLGFLQDPDGTRFHDSYFAENPGYWTHGDLVEFKPEGSVVMHGRSDGTMNIRGIRVGPADIYRVIEGFSEVDGALAVEQRMDSQFGHARIVMLLVLRPGFVLDPVLRSRIRKAVGYQASAAHVPGVILQVDQLPTTHTGKLSERSARDAVNGLRISNNGALRNPECLSLIASHPGLTEEDEYVDVEAGGFPLTTAEGGICEIALTKLCEEMLGVAPIGRDDDFFDMGVDSLGAIRLILSLEKHLGLTLPITFIYEAPTIARMIPRLETIDRREFSHLVQIKEGGRALPFYIIHGLGGNVIELFKLGRLLRYEGPVYAIQARGVDGQAEPFYSIEDMADAYIEAIRARQPNGPYQLSGYSFGGLVAFEIARRLEADGELVDPLILLDTTVDERYWPKTVWLRKMIAIARKRLLELNAIPPRQLLQYMAERVRGVSRQLQFRSGTFSRSLLENGALEMRELDLPRPLFRVRGSAVDAMTAYRPGKYGGEVVLMRCAERNSLSYDAAPLWALLSRKLVIHEVAGNHDNMISEPAVESLADAISLCLSNRIRSDRTSVAAVPK